MSEINALLDAFTIPRLIKAKQYFDNQQVENVEQTVRDQLNQKKLRIQPGERIAITAGSRGIDQYVQIMRVIVSFIKAKGGKPFIVPAMGSHGGAAAEGQREVLRHYGITEESMGAPVISSMETVQIGTTDKGLGVYIDKNAYEADGIILFNRIKPHTSFRGRYESGLVKMLAIGLAKQKGAEATHFLRYENMAENIVSVGKLALERLNVICGVCTIENGYSKVAETHVLGKEEILQKEPDLLQTAWKKMPRIALDEIDVLIVGEIGKDISGTGMDTNIIGRFHTNAASGGPATIKLGILDVSDKSEGNANGMGLADFMTERMYKRVNFTSTYLNTLTSAEPASSRMPMVLEDDKRVIQACLKLCGRVERDSVRMVVIKSTKHLDEIYMSEAAVKEAVMSVEKVGSYIEVPFDEQNNLCLF